MRNEKIGPDKHSPDNYRPESNRPDNYRERRRRGVKDFPELQVGFPERNDASSPTHEMERIHVDLRTMGISKKSAAEIAREEKRSNVP